MAIQKRYGVFLKSDPTTEVFGHDCRSKETMLEYCDILGYCFVGIVEVSSFDKEMNYLTPFVPVPA